MVRVMLARLFPRRIATLVLALGLFLCGAAPSWALPGAPGKSSLPAGMSMMMPGMAMQTDCMASMERGVPSKGTPCKNSDVSCGMCTVCAISVTFYQASSPVQLISDDDAAIPQDASQSGIAVLPPLPPPILRA